MIKKYESLNVYEAYLERMHFIFEEFENIYVSFSGGKDSSLLLHMTLDFAKKYYPDRKIGVFHQDFEAQYSMTTKFVEETFEKIKDEVYPYWVCLPMATRTAVSNYEMFWYPWDDTQPTAWVRPMPKHPYVINLENNPMTTYKYRMHQEDLAKQFARWYRMEHGGGKTICLLGMRTDESLHRYNGIVNKRYAYKERCWITSEFKDVWSASPIYDWSVSDVWYATFKFNYPYNSLYDLYFKAGLSPEKMRVASPFNDYAKESLNMYRIIDPPVWSKLVGRVRGANFCAIYGKTRAMGYKSLKLPEGHTWESYTKFLLDTLPVKLRNNYIRKFQTSINFWHQTGGGLKEETIAELEACGYRIMRNGISNYTVDKLYRIIFLDKIPDHTDDIKSTKDVPSWKRMCFCILKNDHTCRFMGFGLTREQQARINTLKIKYEKLEW